MCSLQFDMEHQLSHQGVDGELDAWTLPGQNFGPSQLSSTQNFEPSVFLDYTEHVQSYSNDLQRIFPAEPSPMESLPLDAPSPPTWPSMLTEYTKFTAPVVVDSKSPVMSVPDPMITVLSPLSVAPTKENKAKWKGASSRRRTLTDEERRQICKYSKDHPSAKQTDIGKKFAIDRSTVSKVLSQSDKLLSSNDAGSYSSKQRKGKNKQFERTLLNWARKKEKQGHLLTNDVIGEKAVEFAIYVGDNQEDYDMIKSKNWLRKFKQKNEITGTNFTRRSSEPQISSTLRTIDSSSSLALQNLSETFSSSHVPKKGLINKEERPDQVADYNQITSESNSSSNLTTFSGPLSTTSSTSYAFLLDSSTMISPQQSKSPPSTQNIPRARRKTFPTISIGHTYYCFKDLQDAPDDVTPCSEAPLLAESEKKESFVFTSSPTMTSTVAARSDHQSYNDSLGHSLPTIEDKVRNAFLELINYFAAKDKNSINYVENDYFLTLQEAMGLKTDLYQDSEERMNLKIKFSQDFS